MYMTWIDWLLTCDQTIAILPYGNCGTGIVATYIMIMIIIAVVVVIIIFNIIINGRTADMQQGCCGLDAPM